MGPPTAMPQVTPMQPVRRLPTVQAKLTGQVTRRRYPWRWPTLQVWMKHPLNRLRPVTLM
jgi:hypothetical protein